MNYQQIASTQKTQALSPKIQEIREKYANNKDLQNQMTALLYEETKVNPLAGCLPAILQIPVFLALYRSFLSLAQQNKLEESFLWLPNLQGPVYNGARNIDWLTVGWHDNIPPLGWHDTLAFLTIPLFLYVAQAISLQVLTPPSDDPTVQQTQVGDAEVSFSLYVCTIYSCVVSNTDSYSVRSVFIIKFICTVNYIYPISIFIHKTASKCTVHLYNIMHVNNYSIKYESIEAVCILILEL